MEMQAVTAPKKTNKLTNPKSQQKRQMHHALL